MRARLGRGGAALAVNHVSNPDETERVAKAIRDNGNEARTIRAHVSREDHVQEIFGKASSGTRLFVGGGRAFDLGFSTGG